MPEQLTGPIMATYQAPLRITGRFAPDTANPPTYPTTVHPGWSVARVSAGLFDVTIADRNFPVFVGGVVTLQKNAGSDLHAGIVSYTAPTATVRGKVRIRLATAAGTETDLAAHANNQVHFDFAFSTHEKLV